MDSKNTKIKLMKDKIRSLLDRNKQISQDLKQTPTNSDQLKQEKANNNNELRKQRTEKYNEEMKYISECYKLVKQIDIIKTQYEFSNQFLNQNKYYLGNLICEQRRPSVSALSYLVQKLDEIKPITPASHYIDNLIDTGHYLIAKKLIRFI